MERGKKGRERAVLKGILRVKEHFTWDAGGELHTVIANGNLSDLGAVERGIGYQGIITTKRSSEVATVP